MITPHDPKHAVLFQSDESGFKFGSISDGSGECNNACCQPPISREEVYSTPIEHRDDEDEIYDSHDPKIVMRDGRGFVPLPKKRTTLEGGESEVDELEVELLKLQIWLAVDSFVAEAKKNGVSEDDARNIAYIAAREELDK